MLDQTTADADAFRPRSLDPACLDSFLVEDLANGESILYHPEDGSVTIVLRPTGVCAVDARSVTITELAGLVDDLSQYQARAVRLESELFDAERSTRTLGLKTEQYRWERWSFAGLAFTLGICVTRILTVVLTSP